MASPVSPRRSPRGGASASPLGAQVVREDTMSNEPKWTPGPHTFTEKEVLGALVAFEGAQTWLEIPEIGATIRAHDATGTERLERARADMRRAAAAPKMYEALKALIACVYDADGF